MQEINHELISTTYLPVSRGYIAYQLYCPCGGEMDGEAEDWGPFARRVWFKCQECGRMITGRDAECLLTAFINDLI